VPHERKAMWEESVRGLLLARQNCTLHSITLRVLGGESDIEYRVRHLLENANPTAAIYCKTGECEIRITARAENDSSAEKMCRAYATKFYDLLGDAVYDEDVTGLEETLVHTLKKKGLTIATAESCTGGMIAQRLTNVSGASEVFGFGFVTYWEQAKAKMIGVDPAAGGFSHTVRCSEGPGDRSRGDAGQAGYIINRWGIHKTGSPFQCKKALTFMHNKNKAPSAVICEYDIMAKFGLQ